MFHGYEIITMYTRYLETLMQNSSGIKYRMTSEKGSVNIGPTNLRYLDISPQSLGIFF